MLSKKELPNRNKKNLFILTLLTVIPSTTFAKETTNSIIESSGVSIESISRGLLGILTILAFAWLFSTNRKSINWSIVGRGLLLQLILAVGILYIPVIEWIFDFGGKAFNKVLDFTGEGSTFLFGDLVDLSKMGYIFVFQVLPTIVFFSALTSMLFYLGIIQKVVYGLAWVMTRFMSLSGPESLSVAGNIFLGQTESPLMIKAYLERLNKSELFLVMTGGMATIAGGVLAAYIGFLGGDDPVARQLFAKHLLTASVMAAPGAVVLSKILFPQTESINRTVKISDDSVGSNILDALSKGTSEGLKLAINVGGMLLVFIAFIAMVNYAFEGLIGKYTGLNTWVTNVTNGEYTALNLQFILGYSMAPFMWLIGVPTADITELGRLLGEKIIINEFIGYMSLSNLKAEGAIQYQKSIIMATYMLCGFANFSSVGIQIGGIGSLAPGKRKWLSELGMRALLAGALASCLSATIIGMIMG